MPDQTITCMSCGRLFTWSTGEQGFYRERGLQSPRRCPDCRGARRQQTTATPAAPRAAQQSSRPITRRHQPPRRVFGIATLVAALTLSTALFLLVPSTPLLAWLLAVNLIALLTFGYDKAIAAGVRTRVPEAVLLGLALLGGSPAAFVGMLLFRHKTSKPAFLVPFGMIVAVQVALLIGWLMLRP